MLENSFGLKINNSIPLLDFFGVDLEEAHRQLGVSVAPLVHRTILHRMKTTIAYDVNRIHDIAAIRMAGIERIQKSSSSPAIIREAVAQYMACLEAWSQGADLASLDLSGINPLELAVWLQDDHPGCQSGVYRLTDGSVLFWHTEEDVDEPGLVRVDQPRIMRFKNNFSGSQVYSFIYPDLLPGPNFNWHSDGFTQFADSLFINSQGRRVGIAANLVTWVVLMVGKLMPAREIIRSVTPVFDGYALFTLSREQTNVDCSRIEFTVDEMHFSSLNDKPGSLLLQTNAFSTEACEMAIKYERNPFSTRKKYENRIQQTRTNLEKIAPTEICLGHIQKMLCSRRGGRWAFANNDVKAHLYGRLSSNSLEIHSHPGMALDPGSG
jgi:hypothetical protein